MRVFICLCETMRTRTHPVVFKFGTGVLEANSLLVIGGRLAIITANYTVRTRVQLKLLLEYVLELFTGDCIVYIEFDSFVRLGVMKKVFHLVNSKSHTHIIYILHDNINNNNKNNNKISKTKK